MYQEADLTQSQAAGLKRTRVSACIIFILIPLTIALGCTVLKNERYVLVSLGILIYMMIPFFMVFERRKPKAREVVLIAVMAALTVCAQLGFLAGLAFNKVDTEKLKERDFKVILGPVLCVAFAIALAYICYLIWPGEDTTFFGWRLYAFGAAGLLAGVLLQKKRLPVDNVTLTVFTFLVTFIIYGGIMNLCTMVTSLGLPGSEQISLNTLRALYISGAPYDALHAATAALCVYIFGNYIITRLERIKI